MAEANHFHEILKGHTFPMEVLQEVSDGLSDH
jgi:hypothetical protein